jgi:thiol:disulfide interchange protein DsbA
MLMRGLTALFGLFLAGAAAAQALAPGQTWVEGKNYYLIDPPQPTETGTKVEVLEVFSYGCPHCNEFQPIAENIKKALPAGAQMRYLPAEFGRESWKTFARAYYAAEAMGILDKTHGALFRAVYVDKKVDGLNPTLEQIADVYHAAAGVKAEDVIATANSFAVNTKLKRADAFIKATGVDGTPTIIINGKYRLDGRSAGSFGALQELIKFLVAKEGAK